MGMMLKPRCNRRGRWRKDLLDQKKARMSRSKIKELLVVFFIGKALSITNLYHVVRL